MALVPSDELKDRYRASMILSAAGDALGYRNMQWEYCKSGPQIHRELAELGGLAIIKAMLPDWPVSDDTVMHLATAEALIECEQVNKDLFSKIARKYIESMDDMEGRKPGPTSIKGCSQLKPDEPNGYVIPFNPTGSGCGAAMRAMCIGLRFPDGDFDSLVAISVESGRMTHHHPTGYLGALAAAFFTSCAIRKIPIVTWGRLLYEEVLPKALNYVKDANIAVDENVSAWNYFSERWSIFLKERGIDKADKQTLPTFPVEYDVAKRDEVWNTWSIDGWAGRSGHDAPMIAYDALLAAGNDWEELCRRAMFHAGDSDSTGVIAGSCFGALYGLDGVPTSNFAHLEYHDRICSLAEGIYDVRWRTSVEIPI